MLDLGIIRYLCDEQLRAKGKTSDQLPANCLIEIGAVLSAGKPARRLFLSSLGGIGAAFSEGRVTLANEYGGKALLFPKEIKEVLSAMADWLGRRDEWAAFLATERVLGGYVSGDWSYYPPGRDSEHVKVGHRFMGNVKGQAFTGEDETRPLDKPVLTPSGATIIAELRHRGEPVNQGKEEIVGVVYRISDEARMQADRHNAHLTKGAGQIHLGVLDEEFLRELLAAIIEQQQTKENKYEEAKKKHT